MRTHNATRGHFLSQNSLQNSTRSRVALWTANFCGDRRFRRRSIERMRHVSVIGVTLVSFLMVETRADQLIRHEIHAPNVTKFTVGATSFTYASVALSRAVSGIVNSMAGLFGGGCSTPTAANLSPAGVPYPWQASAPLTPFCGVNLSSGNVLTGIPVVGWQTLGRPINFALYHNSKPTWSGLNVALLNNWTHSYSRKLDISEWNNGLLTLYTDEGGAIPFQFDNDATYFPPTGLDQYLHIVYNRNDGEFILTYRNRDVDIFDKDTGRLEYFLDASGHEGVLVYDGSGRLEQITDASGNQIRLGYDSETDKLNVIAAPAINNSNVWDPLSRDYKVIVDDIGDVLSVSTARVDEEGVEDRAFWVNVTMADDLVIQIVDRLGTQHNIDYDTSGYPGLVTLDTGGSPHLALNRTLDFTWYPLDTNCVGNCYPIVCTAEVTGSRTSPTADTTTYSFDSNGRLLNIVDPEQRQVCLIGWNGDNRPDSVTNVYGGVTAYEYDDRGNIELITPPVGDPTSMLYDGVDDLLLEMTDATGATSIYYYTDSANPRKPSQIDGGGASVLDLEWGSDDWNLGKLTTTVSPNGIEQGFRYSEGEALHGKGTMIESRFGRVMNDGPSFGTPPAPMPLQDRIMFPDRTGNVNVSGGGTENLNSGINVMYDNPNQPVVSTNYAEEDCTMRATCCGDYTADGNKTDFCKGSTSCGCGHANDPSQGGPESEVEYNGNDQIVFVPMGKAHEGHTEYTFAYDALGRMTQEKVGTPEDYYGEFNGIQTHPDHETTWTRDDALGRIIRLYTPGEELSHPNLEAPLDTTYDTDLAGRITSILTKRGGVIAETTTYQYNDSLELPAVKMTREDGTSSEWYVDAAGQITSIVHRSALGGEVLSLSYGRDDANRIETVTQSVNQGDPSVTTYTYGHGQLTSVELDDDGDVQPNRLYYDWFANFEKNGVDDEGDRHRLVSEMCLGGDKTEYMHVYRYDAGGNRLVKVKYSNMGSTEVPDWRPNEMIRYNYAFQPDGLCDAVNGYSLTNFTGEPDPDAAPCQNTPVPIKNSYESTNRLGRDELLSYKRYALDATQSTATFADSEHRFTIYEYNKYFGSMSKKIDWDSQTKVLKKMEFAYAASRLIQTSVRWYHYDSQDPSYNGDYGFQENYGYDIFGRRVAMRYCVDPDYAHICKSYGTAFDFAGGELICERETDDWVWGGDQNPPVEEPGHRSNRFASVYTWGPTGIVTRRGVARRAGHWDPELNHGAGGFVPENYNQMCNYHPLADAMGNSVGVIDPYNSMMNIQEFDAFGCSIGWHALSFVVPCGDWKSQDPPWDVHEGDAFNTDDFDPNETPGPAWAYGRWEAGRQQWRGHEGSQTDVTGWDQFDNASPDRHHKAHLSAHCAPSSGLVYMQARYYDPEVGRFTQWDPVPYGPEMAWGQNNRWAYCANDPVNCSDPSGKSWNDVLGWGSILASIVLITGAFMMMSAAATGVAFLEGIAALCLGFAALAWGLSLLETDPCTKAFLENLASTFTLLATAFACGKIIGDGGVTMWAKLGAALFAGFKAIEKIVY